jgi:CelD/BcsL family acetyltransferase involved in cellulose biosynthesis
MSSVIDIDPVSDPRWAELVSGGGGTLFNSPRWLHAVSRSYDFDAHASVVMEEGALTGGLAYTVIEDVRGRRLVAFPFSDFCEPVAPDLESWHRMVDPLLDLGPLTVRCREGLPPVEDDRFRRSVDHRWHATSINHEIDDDTRFAQLDSKFRQNVRRAMRAGVDVTICSDTAHVRGFYDLHVGTRLHKHRLLPQPYRFFERLSGVFGDDLLVALAHHDGRPIAGILFLVSGESLYYKYNASDVTADLSVRPNELLLWEGMRLAAERGWNRIDLGVSSVDQPDLIRYKRKVANEELSVVSMHHARGVRVPGPGLDELLASVETLMRSERVGPDVTGRVAELMAAQRLGESGATGVDGLLGGLADALIGEEYDRGIGERAGDLLYRFFA